MELLSKIFWRSRPSPELPCVQNSETRYFTRLSFFFCPISWELPRFRRFKTPWKNAFVFFKLRAPTLCDPTKTCLGNCPLLKPWSFRFKKLLFVFFFWELSADQWQKCRKHEVFDTKSLSLCRLQLGAQNLSKIGSFSENIVFCDTKLKHPWNFVLRRPKPW